MYTIIFLKLIIQISKLYERSRIISMDEWTHKQKCNMASEKKVMEAAHLRWYSVS